MTAADLLTGSRYNLARSNQLTGNHMFAAPGELGVIPASERRRRIFERTKARYAKAGIGLDDPDYLRLIEQWIAGKLTMPDVARQWNAMRMSRAKTRGTKEHRRAVSDPPAEGSNSDEPLDDVPPPREL